MGYRSLEANRFIGLQMLREVLFMVRLAETPIKLLLLEKKQQKICNFANLW